MTKANSEVSASKAVCLFGGEEDFNRTVQERLRQCSVSVHRLASLEALSPEHFSQRALILVVDLETLPEERSPETLRTAFQGVLQIPIDLVCLVPRTNLRAWLAARRAGAMAYFEKPVSPELLANWCAERSGHGVADPYRILVLHGEGREGTRIAEMLSEAGMMSQLLEDPLKIDSVLEEFQPDLLVVDQEIQVITAPELVDLIRDRQGSFPIPILFFSDGSGSDCHRRFLQHSGYDYFSLPIEPVSLVTRVQDCIHRLRAHQVRRMRQREQDPSSGLYTRMVFLKFLNQALFEPEIQEPGNGVLFIALDHAKALIDQLGQGCRDLLIAALGRCIRNSLSPVDVAGRFESFSFAVLARQRTDEKALKQLAETIREAVQKQEEIGRPGSLSVSIGIGLFYPPADDALTMISRARKGCAKAQAKGGNRTIAYVRALPKTRAPGREEALAALISKALHADDLELMYQPIVPMGRLSSRGFYEVSLRLRAPDGEYIPPLVFLPTARRYELIPEIDRWVLKHALDRFQQEQHRSHSKALRFFIHQTMETVGKEGWVSWFRDQIIQRDLMLARPILQFQLRDVLRNLETARQVFPELRKLRIKLCLVQVENRSKALECIRQFPIAFAKLSIPLVQEGELKALAHLTSRIHRRKAAVIAPGIEQPNTIVRMMGLRIDYIQGTFLQFPSTQIEFDFREITI